MKAFLITLYVNSKHAMECATSCAPDSTTP